MYHIVFRGVNRCHLFEERADYLMLIDHLSTVKQELGMELLAYCLMSNHVHLILRERSPKDITVMMKKVLSAYATWFNKKYERCGALIANRYKSKPIEDDSYLLTVVRYIHHNPSSAGIAQGLDRYEWSSYCDYLRGASAFTTTDFVLSLFHSDRQTAVSRFVDFHSVAPIEDYSEPEKTRKSDSQVRVEMMSLQGGREPHTVVGFPRQKRNDVLVSLRGQGLSIRQVERVTGISRGVIAIAWQSA